MSRKRLTLKLSPESVYIGALLSLVAGYLDAYTYIGRDGVFSTAQTGNMVLLGVEAARGDFAQALVHIPPIVAFVTGVFVAEMLKHPWIVRMLVEPSRAVLLLEIIVLFGVGFLPSSVPNMVVTMMIVFVGSLQISTFRSLEGWTYNTTVTTGNLFTAARALYISLFQKELSASLQFKKFATVISSFLFGAFIGTFATYRMEDKAVWIASIILIVVFFIMLVSPAKGISSEIIKRDTR
ncbi:YoaK family protein [Paenibacillus sp. Marseille-Q4541]|uniref:YoaK family protein n=1 Tax=Paenibacillus sp. Marseille-Q4541 TaxID=2831522 RepID=UPI001BAE4820|nr:YoaK family protein [Paenibacillus sp. Marseille-Q4541]